MITVRLATLADTTAITAIHRSAVQRWEHIDAQGKAREVPYDALSLYERWQHGGPWLSVEMCAVHLNRLLAGSGIPLVAELDGQVLAEAEVYENFEPQPFGHHLELAVVICHAAHTHKGLGTALVQYIVHMARLMKCERISVSHAETPGFYEKLGFVRTAGGHGIRIPAQTGRVVYQSVDLADRNPAQIKGWQMPLGRYRSSRQEWDKLFPQDWAAGLPELLTTQTLHLKLTVSGNQNVILFVQEANEIDSQLGDVHISCWSARPLSPTMLTALRDWAFRAGYKTLVSYAMDSDLALLGADVQATDFLQDYYELAL